MALRRLALLTVVIASVLPFAPGTDADAGALRGVGSFVVDAAGHARGANVAATVVESTGEVQAVRSLGRDARVLDGLAVEGFRPSSKLAGVGSSSLLLAGGNADVLLHDTRASPLVVVAREDLRGRADLARGTTLDLAPDARRADVLASDGGRLATLLVLGDGRLHRDGSAVGFVLRQGDRLVLRGDTPGGDPAWDAAVADALAQGTLRAEAATDLLGAGAAESVVRYGDAARLGLDTVPGGVVVRTAGTAAVALDLAYETLGAVHAKDVRVFVDGRETPSLVSVADGRTLLLVPLGDDGPHRVAVVASAGRGSEAQSLVEARARVEASVAGAFTLHGGSRVAGSFVATRADGATGDLLGYTLLHPGVQVFERVSAGPGPGRPDVRGDALALDSAASRILVRDDPAGTLLVDAVAHVHARFDLADGVAVRSLSDRAVALGGPRGLAATMAIVMADGSSAERSGFAPAAPGVLTAVLEPGARLVFRAEPAAGATADALAVALAEGRVGAHALVGTDDGAPASSILALLAPTEARETAGERGRITLRYVSHAPVLVLDGRGGALAARAPRDVLVQVDGAPARLEASVHAVLAASAAAYAVETSPAGDPRVVVNVGAAARGVTVLVESALESSARDGARSDAFGTFRLFHDGRAVGRFVSLRTDQASGVLSDYTMIAGGTRVFTSVAAGASAFASSGAEGATTLLLKNRETTVEASDVTGGFLKVAAREAADVRYNLDARVAAREVAPNVVALEGPNNLLGTLVVTDVEGRPAHGSGLALEDGAVVARLLPGAQALFRTHVGIETELTPDQRAMMADAIGRGHVAGHVVVQTERALAEDATATSAVATAFYGDVQILAAATRDLVELTVSSTTTTGRTLLVSLDAATIPGMAEGRASILLDGRAVPQASSYADVLDPNDDHGQAEYYVLAGDAGMQVLLSIPHFSTRSVTLKGHSPLASPSLLMWATVALSIIVVAETAFLVRRRST